MPLLTMARKDIAARTTRCTRSCERLPCLRPLRLRPGVEDADKPESLDFVANDVVHFAPPPPSGPHVTRKQLIAALTKAKSLPQRFLPKGRKWR